MAAKAKPVDKSKIVTKIVRQLKKEFGGLPKRPATSVLETVLFGVCLENATYEQAQTAFDRLATDFFDWNEIRVSTITELLPVFDGLPEPEHKAHRIRALLYYVFDHQYSYDFESLKKKSLDLAQKQLSKIKHMTPFLRHYLLQLAMGTHTIPCDNRMLEVSVFLGLLPYGANTEDAADALKSLVRKSDGTELFWLLKNLSSITKTNFFDGFDFESEEGMKLENAVERLGDLLSGKAKRRAGRQKVEAAKAAVLAEAEAKAAARAAKRRAAAQARAEEKARIEAEEAAEAERIAAEKEKAARARAAQKRKAAKKKKTVKAPKKAAKKATKPTRKVVQKKAAKKKAVKKKVDKKKSTTRKAVKKKER
jgi:endonuclease-3